MKKRFRKLTELILCTVCVLLLCGFAPFTKPAELKNPNTRLIDLGEMVRDSKPGHSGNREASQVGETEEKDGTREGDGGAQKRKDEEKQLTVTVEYDRIYVNGEQMKDLNALEVRLALDYRDTRHAKLVDDYAVYQTYTDVRKALLYAGIRPEEERIR